MLEKHRFPHTVTRRRFAVTLNQYAEPITTHVDAEFPASIQPIELDPLTLPEGVRLSDRLRVYTLPGVLRGVDPATRTASDGILVDGIEFNIESFITWRGSHTRADLVRRHT